MNTEPKPHVSHGKREANYLIAAAAGFAVVSALLVGTRLQEAHQADRVAQRVVTVPMGADDCGQQISVRNADAVSLLIDQSGLPPDCSLLLTFAGQGK